MASAKRFRSRGGAHGVAIYHRTPRAELSKGSVWVARMLKAKLTDTPKPTMFPLMVTNKKREYLAEQQRPGSLDISAGGGEKFRLTCTAMGRPP